MKYKNVSGVDLLVPHPSGTQRLVLAGALHDSADFIGDPSGQPEKWQAAKAPKASNDDSQEG